jgi:hypothetical protein
MSRIAVKSSAARTRISRAEAWLQSHKPDEELLLIGAALDAAMSSREESLKRRARRSAGIG